MTVQICHSLQPETLKSVVEEGRNRIPILYQPIIPIIGRQVTKGPTVPREVTAKVFRNPFRLFLQPDILLLLAVNAMTFAIFYGINASVSSLFLAAYPFLNETKIGLCYLAMGGGSAVASSIIGPVLDWEYQTFRKRAEIRITALGLTTADITKEDFFPLEQVRLRTPSFSMHSCSDIGSVETPALFHPFVGFKLCGIRMDNSTTNEHCLSVDSTIY